VVAIDYSGWARALGAVYNSDQVRAAANAAPAPAPTANAGFVPVATLADDDIDLVQPTTLHQGSVVPTAPAPKIEHVDRAKLMTTALRARRVYPGPVGELIARELSSWADMGFRYGGGSTIAKLVAAVLAAPLPESEAAAA